MYNADKYVTLNSLTHHSILDILKKVKNSVAVNR